MAAPAEGGFHVADYILFSVFFLISVGIGIYHALTGGRQRTLGEYMVANRQMQTIPVAISMFVSIVSGVLVLGHPAEIYTRGGQFVMRAVGHVVAGFVAGPLFVPLFFKLSITSAFEVSSRAGPKFVGRQTMEIWGRSPKRVQGQPLVGGWSQSPLLRI